ADERACARAVVGGPHAVTGDYGIPVVREVAVREPDGGDLGSSGHRVGDVRWHLERAIRFSSGLRARTSSIAESPRVWSTWRARHPTEGRPNSSRVAELGVGCGKISLGTSTIPRTRATCGRCESMG